MDCLEDSMPNYTARMRYLNAIYDRYHKASKEDKSDILDEFSKVCAYNRNYTIQLLSGPKPSLGFIDCLGR